IRHEGCIGCLCSEYVNMHGQKTTLQRLSSNAGAHLLPKAGAERTLEAVRCSALLAAVPPWMPSHVQHTADFIETVCGLPSVQDRVTVGAYWAQVSDRINRVLVPDFRKRGEVMDMNKPCADLAVCFLKAKATDDTGGSELCNTLGSCAWVPLVGI